MSDIVGRLRAAVLDKDNFPRMDSERQVPVGLANEAADEIEALRAQVERLKTIIGYLEDHADIPIIIRREARRALEPK